MHTNGSGIHASPIEALMYIHLTLGGKKELRNDFPWVVEDLMGVDNYLLQIAVGLR